MVLATECVNDPEPVPTGVRLEEDSGKPRSYVNDIPASMTEEPGRIFKEDTMKAISAK